ncbi:MAG: CPBP family glutamic-type intramembrane protease [Terriglobia bacterium]
MRPQAKKELLLFFGLTLAAMYILCFTVVLFLTPMKAFSARHLGGADPQLLLYPAAYSPTLVALALTAVYGRKAGLRRLFASIFRWRVGISGWLLAFLLFPAMWLVVAIIRHFTTGAPIHWQAWYANFPLLVFSTYLLTDTGGLGEETGWRGYAMPRLLERFTPTAAGLIVGFFFGIWHLPGWFLSGLGGHFAQIDFASFVGFTMLLSVVMAYLYVRTQGSVLLAGIIPHMIVNLGGEKAVSFYSSTWEYLGYLAIFALILVTVEARKMFAPPPFDPKLSPQYYTDAEERAAIEATAASRGRRPE